MKKIYRNRLKNRIRNKDEKIPELYRAIGELTQKAYPKMSKAVEFEITLDYFLDAINNENLLMYIIGKKPDNNGGSSLCGFRL